MKAEFTEDEKTLLRGKASGVANKYNCSKVYVNQITKGEREINSPLSKSIYSDLKTLVELLKPETTNK